MTNLANKKCVPCKGGALPMPPDKIKIYQTYISPEWNVIEDNKKISRRFKFKNYRQAWNFVNKVSEIAEAEGHHPDIKFGWGFAEITLWTHAIKGLFENDFILTAKIDKI